jgi:hypothetical protein
MASTATGYLEFVAYWNQVLATTGQPNTTNEKTYTKRVNWGSSGTGSGQINEFLQNYRTLAAGATEILDFAGGLTNNVGETVTFATIKGMAFFLLGTGDLAPDGSTAGTAATHLVVGNTAADQFVGPFGAAAHTHRVDNSGGYGWAFPGTGYTVTGGSVDKLLVTNGDGANQARYILAVWGTK